MARKRKSWYLEEKWFLIKQNVVLVRKSSNSMQSPSVQQAVIRLICVGGSDLFWTGSRSVLLRWWAAMDTDKRMMYGTNEYVRLPSEGIFEC